VNPAVATVLGWAILGESLGPLQIAGMVSCCSVSRS